MITQYINKNIQKYQPSFHSTCKQIWGVLNQTWISEIQKYFSYLQKNTVSIAYLIRHGCVPVSNSMFKKKKLSSCRCQRHLFSVQASYLLFYWNDLDFHLSLPLLLSQNHHEVLLIVPLPIPATISWSRVFASFPFGDLIIVSWEKCMSLQMSVWETLCFDFP